MSTNIQKTSSMNDNVFLPLIGIISIVVPALVAILFYMPKAKTVGFNIQFLPLLNACINFTVSILLILAFRAIKNKKIDLHKKYMSSALVLSGIFLLTYVIYHYFKPETHFGGTGMIRTVYFFILITHIFLAAVILPFILFSFYRGLNMQVESHKKWAKITFPLWLYVSITGVLVYVLMSPYYPF